MSAGIVLTPEECEALKAWHDGSVHDAYGDEPHLREAFAASPLGKIMAKVASGAREAVGRCAS